MSTNKQAGAVSLFVVIFAALLISVVTISFLRLMVSDQNRASNSDLSQSAYDSAQAGVEDAKRALLRYQKICNEQGKTACDNEALLINDVACNDAVRVGGVGAPQGSQGEIQVQQTSSSGDGSLAQAYTCVKLKLLTDDYLGSISAGDSKLIPLIGKHADGSETFDRVTVEWFSTEDITQSSTGAYAVSLPNVSTEQRLSTQNSWATNRPSVLRTQLMQFGANFTLASFDTSTTSNQSNANTLFMYPTSVATNPIESFTTRDPRKTTGEAPVKGTTDTPLAVRCQASLAAGGYACTQTLQLPTPVGGGANRTAFLRLTPFYNATHFRVTLSRSLDSTPLKFNGVQPEIDSTGRANDFFRRVSSRVDLIDTSFPYPDGAVDLSGNLCKNFGVTDVDYVAPTGSTATCTP